MDEKYGNGEWRFAKPIKTHFSTKTKAMDIVDFQIDEETDTRQ